jgi:hypothetical protein
MLDSEHALTSFISRPDAFSFVVAFLAGIAGILSLTAAKSGALIGVLISVTTVPAAGSTAVGPLSRRAANGAGIGPPAGCQPARNGDCRHVDAALRAATTAGHGPSVRRQSVRQRGGEIAA